MAMPCVLAAIALLLTAMGLRKIIVVKRSGQATGSEMLLSVCAYLAAAFFASGTALFCMAIAHDVHQAHDFAGNIHTLMRAVVCSLDLFMLDTDSNVLDALKGEHPMLSLALSVQAVLSFVCTVAVILSYALVRFRGYWSLTRRGRPSRSRNRLYLFFGISEAAYHLAADIHKNDPKSITVLIDLSHGTATQTGMASIVGKVVHKPEVFARGQRTGCFVAVASTTVRQAAAESGMADILSAMGLDNIRRLVSKVNRIPGGMSTLLFMSDDESANIADALGAVKDPLLAQSEIYCHARDNTLNRVAVAGHPTIHLTDSSALAAKSLQAAPEAHPVNFVKLSDQYPCTAEGSFDAMIIGFGEVGRDVFRFLYEYSAFVTAGDGRDSGVRAPSNFTIIDRRLDQIKGELTQIMPGIFSDNRYPDDCTVNFIDMDVLREEFNRRIFTDRFLHGLNYAVIAIEDPQLGMYVAARLVDQVSRLRDDFKDFVLYVRCTDETLMVNLQSIADRLNALYGNGTETVRLFGNPSNLFTHDLVIAKRYERAASAFYSRYSTLSGWPDTWDERRRQAHGTGTLTAYRALRRKESQDLSNAMHAHTKTILLSKAFSEQALSGLADRYFGPDGQPLASGRGSTLTFDRLTQSDNTILHRLAMTEHLRWNASHLLMGYSPHSGTYTPGTPTADERQRLHHCLCPWDDLDRLSDTPGAPDFKRYDYIPLTLILKEWNIPPK